MAYRIELGLDRATANESWIDENAETLDEAVTRLEELAAGHLHCSGAINGVRVYLVNGKTCDVFNNRICTNEKWHEIFAPKELRIIPTNPATYAARGGAL